MKIIQSGIAIAGIAIGMSAPASAATNDPEIIIYRFPGVRDNGGAGQAGVATVFHCTNFSGTTEIIRFVTRNFDTAVKGNTVVSPNHLVTVTVATHDTAAYSEDTTLNTGTINQGTTAIAATSTNIICTAATIDASTAAPVGVALRGIRFNPIPGSQE